MGVRVTGGNAISADLKPGMTAVGFGVGNEPLPAVLASYGMKVVATDQAAEDSSDWDATGRWADTGQLMTGLEGLSRPQLLPERSLHAARRAPVVST